jgi:hypothetical protein
VVDEYTDTLPEKEVDEAMASERSSRSVQDVATRASAVVDPGQGDRLQVAPAPEAGHQEGEGKW